MIAACVALNSKLYAIGGQCALGIPLDSAEVYDPHQPVTVYCQHALQAQQHYCSCSQQLNI